MEAAGFNFSGALDDIEGVEKLVAQAGGMDIVLAEMWRQLPQPKREMY